MCIRDRAHAKSKSYYEGGFVEGASDGKRPVCASLDGVVPDSDVITKQSDACALCPRNEWKTDQNGRKGRDCSDYKRLAVLVLPNVTKAVLGQPLMAVSYTHLSELPANPTQENSLAFRRKVFALDAAYICNTADAVALLPDWEQSRGAVAEKALADAIGLRVLYLGQEDGWHVVA